MRQIHTKGYGQSVSVLDQRLVSHGPQAEAGPPPDFVGQVLLEHSHTHLWLLPHHNDRVK